MKGREGDRRKRGEGRGWEAGESREEGYGRQKSGGQGVSESS